MKPKFSLWPALLFWMIGAWSSQPLHAQIDFSSLDKWRGWRPPQERERRDPPEPRERPAEPVNVFHPTDPAELRREEKLRAEKTQRLQSHWIPTDTTADVTVPTTTVAIGAGAATFGLRPSDPVGMAAPLGQVAAMNGTNVAPEALRRSVAILAVIKTIPPDDPDPRRTKWRDEEAAFLAEQAALAMEGAPLQVIVAPDNGQPRQESADTIRSAVADLGQQQARMEKAGRERAAAYGELTSVSAGSDEEMKQKRERVMARFKKTSEEKRQARQQAGADEIIILGPSTTAH